MTVVEARSPSSVRPPTVGVAGDSQIDDNRQEAR
jgi:hypothetical protein